MAIVAFPPLIAIDGVTGDFLKAPLGNVYTLIGVVDFMEPVINHSFNLLIKDFDK